MSLISPPFVTKRKPQFAIWAQFYENGELQDGGYVSADEMADYYTMLEEEARANGHVSHYLLLRGVLDVDLGADLPIEKQRELLQSNTALIDLLTRERDFLVKRIAEKEGVL